jgi:hypothetical protein
MAYSKAKLKTNGDKASTYFKPFLTDNMSDKYLPAWTLQWVSLRRILLALPVKWFYQLNENIIQDLPSN